MPSQPKRDGAQRSTLASSNAGNSPAGTTPRRGQHRRRETGSGTPKKSFLDRWADFTDRLMESSRKHTAAMNAMEAEQDGRSRAADSVQAATPSPSGPPQVVIIERGDASPRGGVVCPSCGGSSCSSLGMIYSKGTTSTSSVGGAAGVAFGAGGHMSPVVAVTSSVGTAQTAFAQQAAPPSQRRVLGFFDWFCSVFYRVAGAALIAFLVSVIAAPPPDTGKAGEEWLARNTMIFMITWVVLSGVFILLRVREQAKARTYNSAVWPKLRRTWETSWQCESCGHLFVPLPRSAAPAPSTPGTP